jgi:hypothetical protein
MIRQFHQAGGVLTGREVITEDSIGRVQHGERRPTHRVTISQVTPDESRFSRCALRAGYDDYVRVKSAHELDAHQLETQAALRERLNGLHCGLCTESKIADGTRLALSAADKPFAVVFEFDLDGAPTGR